MQDEERKAKIDSQTQALYAALGRFSVAFEHVIFMLQFAVTHALQRDGLRTQALAQALLAGQTADPTRRIFTAVIAAVLHDAPDSERAILSNIDKRLQEMIEVRNDIIHRTWFIGWASKDDTDFSTTSSWKIKNTKTGPKFVPRSGSVEDFDRLSSRADELAELAELVKRLQGCLALGKKLSECFDVAANGDVRLPVDATSSG